jgi:hypothetical protein
LVGAAPVVEVSDVDGARMTIRIGGPAHVRARRATPAR